MSKAENMLSILWMLKSGNKITAAELADALEIHIRTVYRYIDALCASGVPIISDAGHNGGYSLLHPLVDAPMFFDAGEQKALVHAASFAREAGYPFEEELEQAVGKLKRYTNPEQLESIDRHEAGLSVIPSAASSSFVPILRELETSAAEGITIRMDYRKSPDGPHSLRHLDPYGVVYWKERWYVVGYCHRRMEIRSFRADRIQSLARTERRFGRPDDFSARRFFLGKLLEGEGEKRHIRLRMTGEIWAIEELSSHWYMNHVLVEGCAGEASFLLDEEAIRTYIPRILLSYGKAIRICEPESLKQTLAAAALELAEYYHSQA